MNDNKTTGNTNVTNAAAVLTAIATPKAIDLNAPTTLDTTLAELTQRIRLRLTRSADDAWQIGHDLKLAKRQVKQEGKKWLDWLKDEFELSESTALRYVRVADLPRDAVAGRKLAEVYGHKTGTPTGTKPPTLAQRFAKLDDATITEAATHAGITADVNHIRALLTKLAEKLAKPAK